MHTTVMKYKNKNDYIFYSINSEIFLQLYKEIFVTVDSENNI